MYISLFYDNSLIGTESSDTMTILSPSVAITSLTNDITHITAIVTSVEPTSGTSSKYIVKNRLFNFVN